MSNICLHKMSLVSKYNVPAPRYTSYPAVPYWNNNLQEDQWIRQVKNAYQKYQAGGISLYIHLPFCESLCTYCACNTRITVNHRVETPYIEALLKEWKLYLQVFGEPPLVKEIHLGGGTPTFFSADNLSYLLNFIINTCRPADEFDFSFEAHPANTTNAHLVSLQARGFKRVSFGVQDFDLKVQEAINRYQTFEEVNSAIALARDTGFNSINIDLVYGLPHQTLESVQNTVQQVIALKPERIAFYSYAHVPWMRPGQRNYNEKDLPVDAVKRQLYLSGKKLLREAGYFDIGMDHFALANDKLLGAYKNGTLHRNFMGYTNQHTKLLIGLGCSAISDTWDAFCQNSKTVEEYEQMVNAGKFPISKGHIHTTEDLRVRSHILNIMCRHESTFEPGPEDNLILNAAKDELQRLEADGLISLTSHKITVTGAGRQFLRNICLALDMRHLRLARQQVFSTTA